MKKYYLIAGILIAIYCGLNYINSEYITTLDNLHTMFDFGGDTEVDIESMYENTKNLSYLSYIISIFTVIFRVLINTLIVYIGFYIYKKQRFKDILKVIICAETVNVIQSCVKIINLAWINPPTSYTDLQVIPFSVLSLFDIERLDQWMIMPLNCINIFEIAYIICASFFLAKELAIKFSYSIKMVLLTYGLADFAIIVLSTCFTIYATK
ncbi:MAG: hypothetical protein HUJ96_09755 [Marinilabiliaceae bacterium]|nr:hypothetical protein [Marinilabiliaceae bacterium]